jgi:hypothetical protein
MCCAPSQVSKIGGRFVERCLTPRSSGAPTACRQARVGGTLYIFANPGPPSHRWAPLSSNVRPRRAHAHLPLLNSVIYLQCTNQVRRMLGIEKEELRLAPAAESILGNWSVNHIPICGRNALLFMSDRSLLSFPILEGKLPFQMQDMPTFLGHGLSQLMNIANLPETSFAKVLKDMNEVALTKTGSQSILGLHRSLARDYDYLVGQAGGIRQANLGSIIAAVNQTPRAKLKFATSFQVVRELLTENAA